MRGIRATSGFWTPIQIPIVKAMQEQQQIIESQSAKIDLLTALVCQDHPGAAVCQ